MFVFSHDKLEGMKYYLMTLLFLALIMGCKKPVNKAEVDHGVEEKTWLQDLNGNPVQLSAFKGQRILLNYWADWCLPCLTEFPSLVSAQEKLKEENYVFLFASPDKKEVIEAFKRKKEYPVRFLQLKDNLEALGIYSLPTTVIYSTDGNEFKRHRGAMVWDSDAIIKLLKEVP